MKRQPRRIVLDFVSEISPTRLQPLPSGQPSEQELLERQATYLTIPLLMKLNRGKVTMDEMQQRVDELNAFEPGRWTIPYLMEYTGVVAKNEFESIINKYNTSIPRGSRKRCPNGTRYDAKTGLCSPRRGSGSRRRSRGSGSRRRSRKGRGKGKRKRCPNGTRYDAKSGSCRKRSRSRSR